MTEYKLGTPEQDPALKDSFVKHYNLIVSGQDECYAHLEAKCKELLELGCKLEDFHIEHEQVTERPFPLGGINSKWVFRLMYRGRPVTESVLTIGCDPV